MKHILSAVLLLTTAMPAAAETVVIRAGHLITDAALPIRGPSSMVVTDGKIVGIGAADMAAPAGAKVIDLSTKTVMPGLIDVHVHLTQRFRAAVVRRRCGRSISDALCRR